MIELYLHKSHASVKLFVNGVLVVNKFFHNRETKTAWMRDVVQKYKGISGVYFEVSYRYIGRDKYKHSQTRKLTHDKKLSNILKAIA